MSQTYQTPNGEDGRRKGGEVTRRCEERERREVARVLRAQTAACILARLLPLAQSPQAAVGQAVEAADLLLRRLRETEE